MGLSLNRLIYLYLFVHRRLISMILTYRFLSLLTERQDTWSTLHS